MPRITRQAAQRNPSRSDSHELLQCPGGKPDILLAQGMPGGTIQGADGRLGQGRETLVDLLFVLAGRERITALGGFAVILVDR